MITAKEIANAVAEKTGISKTVAQSAVSAAVAEVSNHIADGARVRLAGLGTFDVKATKARTARNPATGGTVDVPAGRKIAFKPAADLKSRM